MQRCRWQSGLINIYANEPLLNSESEIAINSKSNASEGDQNDLQDENDHHNDDEDVVARNSFEDIFLNSLISTYSCSLRQFKKLKTCIITNALKMNVKCLEYR